MTVLGISAAALLACVLAIFRQRPSLVPLTLRPSPTPGASRLRRWRGPAVAVALAALLAAAAALVAPAAAQQPIVADGNAVITGFSGTVPPVMVAPGVNPLDKTYIDPNGVSVRVLDLQSPGAPPQAQLLTLPKPFAATASQVGQVFGVALDNATPPNIYVAATSVYGLPIVVPDQDGDGLEDRVKQGTANAHFMAGLFGPSPGGPGAIWRIDGASGEVRLFANVTLNGVANAGPALGGLAFDGASNSLFVADRATGMIHQFGLDGVERGRFDHGVVGRAAVGAPPVPYNGKQLNITSPAFLSENPATFGHAPAARLVFGLGVHGGRLYYAVAEGLQVWSVSIAGGSFGKDPRLEVAVPPGPSPTEISKIVFDNRGRMLLAERAGPTGDYAMVALAQEGIGRVLRYAPVVSGDPNAPRWQDDPDQYAIGFPAQMSNGNGGIALGYRYDDKGVIERASCGGFLWSTGERLRVSNDPATAQRLAQGGPPIVNGLQGNDAELVAPANVPPWTTYFIDKDDRFDDAAARGQIGDVAIPKSCERLTLLLPPAWVEWFGFDFGMPIPPPPPFCPVPGPNGCFCPPGAPCSCPPGTTQRPGLQCCPIFMVPGPGGQCHSLCANGAADLASRMFCMMGVAPPLDPNNFDPNALMCWDGSPPMKVQNHSRCPKPPGAVCPAGYVEGPPHGNPDDIWSNATCDPIPQQKLCGPDQQVGLDGQCHALCGDQGWALPILQCCPEGMLPGPDGQCGPPLKTGCPPEQLSSSGQCCPPGTKPQPNGTCGGGHIPTCPPEQMTVKGVCCPSGQKPQPDGTCGGGHIPICPPERRTSTGLCCPLGSTPQPDGTCQTCPPGTVTNPLTGTCTPQQLCPPNTIQKANGQCCPPLGVTAATVPACTCPPGQTFDGQRCVGPAAPPTPASCFAGYVRLPSGACCRESQATASGVCCPAGQRPDANRRSCVPATPPAHVTPPRVMVPPLVVPPPKVLPPPHRVRPGVRPPPVFVPPPKIVVPPKRPQRPVVTPPPRPPVTKPRTRFEPSGPTTNVR